jgi:lipopolysaccharide export system protein LptA
MPFLSKFRAFMKNPSRSLWLVLVSALWVVPVWAEKADRNKPMNIEADTLRHDDAKQVSVFTGNVVLSKGSIVIRGTQLEVRQDAEGNQFGTVTGNAGRPAFFRQKREGVDEFIEGEGDTIVYDGKADSVRFVQNAQLRRLRGTTLADEITGALIVYNNQTELFSVDGQAHRGVDAPSTGRVRAMLTPKPEATASSPAAASAPVTPVLRPTATLGATPK